MTVADSTTDTQARTQVLKPTIDAIAKALNLLRDTTEDHTTGDDESLVEAMKGVRLAADGTKSFLVTSMTSSLYGRLN